jgi:hypothetical protein
MNDLSAKLSQLLTYLDNAIPGSSEQFNPGITQETITGVLGISEEALPQDFLALYQWRDGAWDDTWNGLGLLCNHLQIDSVHDFKTRMNSSSYPGDFQYEGHDLVPFIRDNGYLLCIVLGRSYSEAAYVVQMDDLGELELAYDSITSMVETYLACFKAGAYFYDEMEVSLNVNADLANEIFSQKNPKILLERMS